MSGVTSRICADGGWALNTLQAAARYTVAAGNGSVSVRKGYRAALYADVAILQIIA